MIYAFLFFYWAVCGAAMFLMPNNKRENHPGAEFFACFLLGGVFVPGRLLAKLMIEKSP